MSDRDLDPIARLLDELGPAEPPADFTAGVMAGLADIRSSANGRVVPFKGKGITMIRKVMWGLAAVATITLGVFLLKGFPPVGGGTEGTIGAAKKYQAQQLADKDVVLGRRGPGIPSKRYVRPPDQGSERAQPDRDAQMHAALQNKDFRSAIANAEVRAALSNADFRNAYSRAELRQALASAELRNAFDAELKAALAQGMRASAAEASLRQATGDVALRNAGRRCGAPERSTKRRRPAVGRRRGASAWR